MEAEELSTASTPINWSVKEAPLFPSLMATCCTSASELVASTPAPCTIVEGASFRMFLATWFELTEDDDDALVEKDCSIEDPGELTVWASWLMLTKDPESATANAD